MANLSSQPNEEKKVDFSFDVDQLNKNAFLNKLSTAVKKIGEYQSLVGKPDEGRKMKYQGVLSQDCKIDIKQHFSKPDYFM